MSVSHLSDHYTIILNLKEFFNRIKRPNRERDRDSLKLATKPSFFFKTRFISCKISTGAIYDRQIPDTTARQVISIDSDHRLAVYSFNIGIFHAEYAEFKFTNPT